MKKFNSPRAAKFAHGVVSALAVAALPVVASTAAPVYKELDNPADVHFNQLLGINDSGLIVGYFGDGNKVPNNGYVLVPLNHYAVENFTNLAAGDSASETQAIGINGSQFPTIVGFYTDKNTGFTHGFIDTNGKQLAADDPAGSVPHVTSPAQNLLGVNDDSQAAGFWTDNSGHEHGFVVKFNEDGGDQSFTEVPPSLFTGAVATQVSNINNYHEVCGFWTDGNGFSHGFTGVLGGKYTTFNVEIEHVVAASTQAFGCNNNGDIVGQFTDASGNLHGFIYHLGEYSQFDAPSSSQTPVLGVQGTLINGINDLGDIVGFYSNGVSRVSGFAEYGAD
jgi:probable HAF family extracellular repeat protein